MMALTFFRESIRIVPCTHDDINAHYNLIADAVTDSPEEAFKARMKLCVDSDTAYKVAGSNCFLYFIRPSNLIAEGVALNGDNPNYMLTLLYEVFSQASKRVSYVEFLLHDGKLLSEYNSMLDRSSIRAYRKSGKPLKVDVMRMLSKIKSFKEGRRLYG